MKTLPKKISPCSIKEAIFEIRFHSSIPDDAVFGIVFNSVKDQYPNPPISLPILQIPQEIRQQDPNLKYAPHYKLQNEFFHLQIGPKAVSLINVNEYKGWDEFQPKIISLFEQLQRLNLFENILRIGLRYMNVYPNENIIQAAGMEVKLPNSPLDSDNINITALIDNSPLLSNMRVVSGAQITTNGKTENGSLIDIDTYTMNLDTLKFKESLKSIHDEEKRIFFDILGEKYLSQLQVEH